MTHEVRIRRLVGGWRAEVVDDGHIETWIDSPRRELVDRYAFMLSECYGYVVVEAEEE